MEDNLRAAVESNVAASATLAWTPTGQTAQSLTVYHNGQPRLDITPVGKLHAAAVRFRADRRYRVAGLVAATVSLDGTDVSGVAIKGSVTRRLNRPSQAQITIPMDAAIGGPGSQAEDGVPGTSLPRNGDGLRDGHRRGHGLHGLQRHRPDGAVAVETGAETTAVTSPSPTSSTTTPTGPQIIEAMLAASENLLAEVPADDAEGPLFLTMGSFAGGGVDLRVLPGPGR